MTQKTAGFEYDKRGEAAFLERLEKLDAETRGKVEALVREVGDSPAKRAFTGAFILLMRAQKQQIDKEQFKDLLRECLSYVEAGVQMEQAARIGKLFLSEKVGSLLTQMPEVAVNTVCQAAVDKARKRYNTAVDRLQILMVLLK